MKRKRGVLVITVCISVMVILSVFALLSMNRMNKQDRFDSLFQYVCESYTFDWRLIKAMAITESSLNPMAVSNCGAKGLMQLMDGTAADMRVIQVFDPEQNVRGGTEYFNWLLKKHQARIKLALASYNGGLGYIKKAMQLARQQGKNDWHWDDIKRTLSHKDCVVNGKRPDAKQIIEYVEKVMKKYEELKNA